MAQPQGNPKFPTTRWSRVAVAGDRVSPEAREALAELCAAYWYPIYTLIRRKGHEAQEAFDLTQEYFARLLEKGVVAAADRDKGRFRTFLRVDCTFFLANHRDHDRALKRGGGAVPLQIDARDADGRYRHELGHSLTPERLFERNWALALIDRALESVGRHYASTGRAELFDLLKPFVTAIPDAPAYATIAREAGMTEGAVQVAVHRLRARLADALREEVGATLNDPTPSEIDDEIRSLFEALGR